MTKNNNGPARLNVLLVAALEERRILSARLPFVFLWNAILMEPEASFAIRSLLKVINLTCVASLDSCSAVPEVMSSHPKRRKDILTIFPYTFIWIWTKDLVSILFLSVWSKFQLLWRDLFIFMLKYIISIQSLQQVSAGLKQRFKN